MRIRISGETPTAAGLRDFLRSKDFHVVDLFPSHTIHLIEGPVEHPTVDSVDSEFERQVVKELAELCGRVFIVFEGGVQRDDTIELTISPDEDVRWKVQRAVFRALSRIRKQNPDRPWWSWRRWLGR